MLVVHISCNPMKIHDIARGYLFKHRTAVGRPILAEQFKAGGTRCSVRGCAAHDGFPTKPASPSTRQIHGGNKFDYPWISAGPILNQHRGVMSQAHEPTMEAKCRSGRAPLNIVSTEMGNSHIRSESKLATPPYFLASSPFE